MVILPMAKASTSFVPIMTRAKAGLLCLTSQASWFSPLLQPTRTPGSPVATLKSAFVRQLPAAARESFVKEFETPHQAELVPTVVRLKKSTIALWPAKVLGGSEGQPTSTKKPPVAVMLSPALINTSERWLFI